MRISGWSALVLMGVACADPAGLGSLEGSLQETQVGSRLAIAASVGADSTGTPVIRLEFSNPSTAVDSVTYGACAFGVQLYADSLNGTLLWQSPSSQPRACIEILYRAVVPPGQTVSVLAGRLAGVPPDVAEPPGGSLLAAAALISNGRLRIISAGPITLVNR